MGNPLEHRVPDASSKIDIVESLGECVRRDQPTILFANSHERFKTEDVTCSKVDLWLIEHLHSVRSKRLAH